jgi:hypothetical protein
LAVGREEICETCGWKTGNSCRAELREYHGQERRGEAIWNGKNWRLSVCLSVCLKSERSPSKGSERARRRTEKEWKVAFQGKMGDALKR